jgi:transposase
VIVFISEKLKAGQIRGVYQALNKKEKQLRQLQTQLRNPRSKRRDQEQLENKILDILKGQYMNNLIDWSLEEKPQGRFDIHFSVDYLKLKEIEDGLGFRIIMTDRHHWNTTDIIKAYYGQAKIENAFKDLKNPYHLALKPQFHWTDQKIKVHYFICVMGYLLSAILLRQVRIKTKFKGSLDSLLDILCNIRLATLLEESKTRGKVKAVYKLEEMSKEEKSILQALDVENLHSNRPKLKGVGVYK